MKKEKIKPDVEFAKRMRTLMSNRNVRLTDIAAATDNAVSTVSTWRRGRVPKKGNSVRKLAQILNVSVEFLINGKGEKTIFSNEIPDGREDDDYSISNDFAEAENLKIRRKIVEHMHAVSDEWEMSNKSLKGLLQNLKRVFPLAKSRKI